MIPYPLEGRSAIVTGGAAGIGFGIAAGLREAGATVTIADLDAGAGESAATALAAVDAPGTAAFHVLDVRDPDAAASTVRAVEEQVGSVDVLVNNAGIYPVALLGDIRPDGFDAVIGVNLRGALFLSQGVVGAMVRRGGGSIINLGSMEAVRPSMPGLGVYGASKAALLALTEHLAVELGPKQIRVNALMPGAVTTDGSAKMAAALGMSDADREAMESSFRNRVPLGRLAVPADLAGAAVFLASDASAYVTGTTLRVDGGLLLSA